MRFFISRAGEDAACAAWIAGVLREEGHEARLQEDFGTGSFPDKIGRALRWADRCIAVPSARYVEKPYARAELDATYARDPAGFIIPVRLEACEIPEQIRHLIYVDFAGKSDEERRRELRDRAGPADVPLRIRTSIQKLPTADPYVIGRDAELQWLEEVIGMAISCSIKASPRRFFGGLPKASACSGRGTGS